MWRKENIILYFIFTEALKLYGNRLSDHERHEIKNYGRIWYMGLDANKIQGDPSEYNYGFDDENRSYKIVSYKLCCMFKYFLINYIIYLFKVIISVYANFRGTIHLRYFYF